MLPLLLLFSCSSDAAKDTPEGDDPTVDTSVTISGSLSLMNAGAKRAQSWHGGVRALEGSTTSDFSISCVTLEIAPSACTEDVAADGAFELTCDGFKGKYYGCFIYKADFSFYQPIVFIETSGEGNGESKLNGEENASVSLVIDASTGDVVATYEYVAPVVETAEDLAPSATAAAQFTGTYEFSCPAFSTISSKLMLNQKRWLEKFADMAIDGKACLESDEAAAYAAAHPGEDNPEMNYCWQQDKDPWFAANNSELFAGATYLALKAAMDGAGTTAARLAIKDEIGYLFACTEMGGKSGKSGMSMYFHPTNAINGTDYAHMGAWNSKTAYETCGSVEKDFTWQYSDGTDTVALDFLADATTNQEMMNNLAVGSDGSSGLQGVIDQWFPVLDALSKPLDAARTVDTLECKYVKQWPENFWLNSFGQISSDAYGTVYEAADACTVWTETDGSWGQEAAPCLFSEAEVSGFASYELRKDASGMVTYVSTVGKTVYENQYIEACFSWNTFWSSNTENPVIPKGGKIVECRQWGEAGCIEEVEELCGPNRYMRLSLVANSSGRLQNLRVGDLAAANYNLVEYGKLEGTWLRSVYDKLCKADFYETATPANTSTEYRQYPRFMSNDDISAELTRRYTNQKGDEGKKFGAIFELLRSDDGPAGSGVREEFQATNIDGTFWFWDPTTGMGSGVAAADIKDGTADPDAVRLAFQNSWGQWDAARIFVSVLEGLKVNEGGPMGTGLTVAYGGDVGDYSNYTTTFINILDNSCLPSIRVEQACTANASSSNTGTDSDNGGGMGNYTCVAKAFCDDFNAELGGCEDANPQNRGTLLTFAKLSDEIYEMFEFRTESYSNWEYTCSKNGGKECTSVPYLCTSKSMMGIKTSDLVYASNVVDNMMLEFSMSESSQCAAPDGTLQEGENKGMGGPPPFMRMTRIDDVR
ncbi:MAG: hypothetical protein A2504_17715 [Bdellovibrionales bacterium RIFOXYD12_FULL_39_22]|nr:MAG: hypothetical protein A2385_15415 [Bdellovibrionales bacterium RIFOXYB1_FULL_39_21]OFZ40603.1 MAG: hypothetical protein A2485_03350 [Bdellovibrionales bacterium RIFOXYC12_FULL_39_17]OFZ50449.1 MAG: hypothetical protein A2404_02715 [Bdellovibrionales bacterium RIFOXYC1_FULL_39_130]OFZ77708.1 MAG: hypothetical protein A2560_05085 [Bdellovibrionales bacterium RIFOXYD1_FULL_39_84]OFZ91742.1 MAG: hypothetical protein A2504_17715 [Bdellovibrionales bacterium RIFOXYD12_FULL_39_22]